MANQVPAFMTLKGMSLAEILKHKTAIDLNKPNLSESLWMKKYTQVQVLGCCFDYGAFFYISLYCLKGK